MRLILNTWLHDGNNCFCIGLHGDSILWRRGVQRWSESSKDNGDTKRKALLGVLTTITMRFYLLVDLTLSHERRTKDTYTQDMLGSVSIALLSLLKIIQSVKHNL